MKNKTLLWCGLGICLLCIPTISNADKKVVTGSICVGGGITGYPTQHTENTPTSFIGEVTLKIAPEHVGGAELNLDLRHPFQHDRWNYWPSKRKFVANLTVPMNKLRTIHSFVTYERTYSARTNDWGWAGVSVDF